MKVRRGDVVLVDHPFSDATGSKVRPALVVQNDRRNAMLAETIVVLITKNIGLAATDPTQVLIDIGTPQGGASGLIVNSSVKCGKVFTVNERLVFRKIGVLFPVLRGQVNVGLRTALDLPESCL